MVLDDIYIYIAMSCHRAQHKQCVAAFHCTLYAVLRHSSIPAFYHSASDQTVPYGYRCSMNIVFPVQVPYVPYSTAGTWHALACSSQHTTRLSEAGMVMHALLVLTVRAMNSTCADKARFTVANVLVTRVIYLMHQGSHLHQNIYNRSDVGF